MKSIITLVAATVFLIKEKFVKETLFQFTCIPDLYKEIIESSFQVPFIHSLLLHPIFFSQEYIELTLTCKITYECTEEKIEKEITKYVPFMQQILAVKQNSSTLSFTINTYTNDYDVIFQ